MKTIVLSEATVIDGVIRARGEVVNVPDDFYQNVRRVLNEVDVKQVELARTDEIEKIEMGQKEREEKEKQTPKTLTIKIDGNGKVTLEPEQSDYAYGDVVVLTAFPQNEKEGAFVMWQIYLPNRKPLTDSNNPTKLQMTTDIQVVAVFGVAGDEPLGELPIEDVKDGTVK